jgi:neutral ceramidase
MIVGTSEIDITPKPGIELSGFAVRQQPSTEVLDPLYVRGLYLEDRQKRMLWLHADLVAFNRDFVDDVRQNVENECGIPASRVILAATHTHSGPATVSANCIGEMAPDYMTWLKERILLAARDSLANREECRPFSVESRVELGVDRRQFASAHTDPRAGAVGLLRSDGTYKAVILSYSMHPVCLRGSWISADWPGETARVLSQALPGRPTVLVSSGACGNINPPEVGVRPEQMRAWGTIVAEGISENLRSDASKDISEEKAVFHSVSTIVPLPLEDWTLSQIHEHADRCLADSAGRLEFREHFASAVEKWRETMIRRVKRRDPPFVTAELFGMLLGDTVFLGVNAEIFSRFTELVRAGWNRAIYPVGCANGMIGYVPAAAAYLEGAYEVEWSMLFYNLPRPRSGCLELLAEHAGNLAAELYP